MTTFISTFTRRTGRSTTRLIRRLTRKAEIKLGLTVSIPPFVKLVADYKADIGDAANDNAREKPGQSA